MKLTLRTLLAWRDRVLPDQEHNELDQKVAATELAQKLEQKIREVLAKTELSAAQVHGRGLATSANSVAEFLDNALAPDQLGPFEKNCFDSDIQLCEVAECHHLLAGMTGQPELTTDLNDEERRRLGEAIKRHSEQLAAETEHAIDVANARAVRAELDALGQGAVDSVGQPQTPRRRSRGAVVAATAAVALLLLLVVILGVQLARSSRANREQQLAARPPMASEVPAVVAEPPAVAVDELAPADAGGGADAPAAPPVAVIDQPQVAQPEPTEQPEMVAATTNPAEADIAASPAAEVPPPLAVGSMADRPQVPQGTAMAIAATAPPAMSPQPAASSSVAVPAAVAPTAITEAFPEAETNVPVLGFLGNDAIVGSGFVLHRTPATDPAELDGWQCLPAGSQLSVQEEVIVPPGLSPSFSIGSVQVQMRPRTHAVLKIDSAGMPRIELLAGSLTIRSSEQTAQLGLAAGSLNGVILSGLSGGVAVDVTRLDNGELAARRTAQPLMARLVPLTQPINWRQTQANGLPPRVLLRGLEAEAVLQPLELVEWSDDQPLVAARQAVDELPKWATPLRRISSLEKDASEALVEAVTSGEPLLKSLIELSVDRRIENRMVAVETLALVARYDELFELLRESPPTGLSAGLWEQLEGQTVPLALSDPTLARGLEKAFRDHLDATQALTAIGLARRNLPAASEDDRTRQLIDLLENDELMLRRYAYAWLCEQFQLDPLEVIQYRADWSAEQRRDGADKWRKRLEKELLLPREPGSSGVSVGQ